jgi:hypothetical protein
MWSLPWNPSGFFLGWGKNNLSAAPTTMLDLGAGNRRIEVHRFRERPSTSGWYISSFFSFEGINWAVQIYPGGQSKAENERYISIFLQQKSEAQTTVTCELRILDKFGNANGSRTFTNTFVGSKATNMHGWRELILRSDILDESKNYLDSNGTLVFMLSLSMKEPTTARPAVFVPQNPFINLMQQKFLDKETADVCFEFSSAEVKEDRAKRLQSSTSFMPTVSF